MDLVSVAERETGTEILPEHGGLVSLDVLLKSLVNGLLCGDTRRLHGLLLVFVEYVSALGLGGLVFEKSVIELVDSDALGGDLGARGDRVDLVHALEGHSARLEGAGNEEQTRAELLEEHAPAAAISSGGEDQDAASLNALAQLGGVLLLSADRALLVLGRVPIECLDH